jgi:hypothetical protein
MAVAFSHKQQRGGPHPEQQKAGRFWHRSGSGELGPVSLAMPKQLGTNQ